MARSKLSRVADKQKKTVDTLVNATVREASFLGISNSDEAEKPHVNLKYYWPDHQCFSQWPIDKLKAFSQFCQKLKQLKWSQIYSSGGTTGQKTGLGYTQHRNIKVLPKHPELDVSPDLTWFELRVDLQSRVHGFRVKDAFFLVFLDKDHEIYRS